MSRRAYRHPPIPAESDYTPRPGTMAELVAHLLRQGLTPREAAEQAEVTPQAVYEVRARLYDGRRRQDDETED